MKYELYLCLLIYNSLNSYPSSQIYFSVRTENYQSPCLESKAIKPTSGMFILQIRKMKVSQTIPLGQGHVIVKWRFYVMIHAVWFSILFLLLNLPLIICLLQWCADGMQAVCEDISSNSGKLERFEVT